MIYIKYLFIILILFILSGCSTSNYNSNIKKVLKPIQEELISFSLEKERYPNINERNIILKKIGFQISNNKYKYLGENFLIDSSKNGIKSYWLKLKLNKNNCSIRLFKYSKPYIYCYKKKSFPFHYRPIIKF